MSAQRSEAGERQAPPVEHPPVDVMTPEEAREAFDRAAQRFLQMSGDEFLRRWQSGEFRDDPDQPGIMDMIMLLPLVR